MSQIQLITNEPIELVRNSNGSQTIQGYASRFYNGTESTEYKLRTNVIERVAPTAYDDYLNSGKEVQLWVNHNEDSMVATTKDDSLTLSVDNQGLKYNLKIDDTDPDIVRLVRKIEKGYVTGSSFSATGKVDVKKRGDLFIRTITTIDQLREVSILISPNQPAYKATEAIIRSELDKEIEEFEETNKRIMKARRIHIDSVKLDI